jgi:hypothetical protein
MNDVSRRGTFLQQTDSTARKQRLSLTKPVHQVFLVGVLLVISQAAANALITDLTQLEQTIALNTSRVTSGSCTYRIEEHRPKDNLLGTKTLMLAQFAIPANLIQQNLLLEGKGWFAWVGTNFAEYTQSVSLDMMVMVGKGTPLKTTIIEKSVVCQEGQISKLITSRDPGIDVLKEKVSPAAPGTIIRRKGIVDSKLPQWGSFPRFHDLAWFSIALVNPEGFLKKLYLRAREEEGLVVLSGNNRERLYLDPQKAYMPIKRVVGTQGRETLIQETEYANMEGVWFPTKMTTATFADGNPRFKVICILESKALNQTVAPERFTLTFPEGTEMGMGIE